MANNRPRCLSPRRNGHNASGGTFAISPANTASSSESSRPACALSLPSCRHQHGGQRCELSIQLAMRAKWQTEVSELLCTSSCHRRLSGAQGVRQDNHEMHQNAPHLTRTRLRCAPGSPPRLSSTRRRPPSGAGSGPGLPAHWRRSPLSATRELGVMVGEGWMSRSETGATVQWQRRAGDVDAMAHAGLMVVLCVAAKY